MSKNANYSKNPETKFGGKSKRKPNKDWKKGKTNKWDEDKLSTTKEFNSPDWLNHNPELIEAAGKIVFAKRLGQDSSLDVGGINIDTTGTHTHEVRTAEGPTYPSFMVNYYVPTIGVSDDEASSVNLVASQMAAYIRTQISGSRSYDPNDLIMHIMALSSIVDCINMAVRAYSIARNYSAWDITSPRTYLEAMGFDADDVQANLLKFNNLINQATLKMCTFAIPGNLKFILRHAALTANIFSDGQDIMRSQKFFFMPTGFHAFTIPTGGGPSYLAYTPWMDLTNDLQDMNHYTIDMWFAYVQNLISKVLNNQDFWIIDGDIRKAFEGKLMSLNTIPVDINVSAVYDPGFSTQFENMTIPNFCTTTTMGRIAISNNITQVVDANNNYVRSKPEFNYILNDGAGELSDDTVVEVVANGLLTEEAILNFHWHDVKPIDVAYATQLTTLYDVITVNEDEQIRLILRPKSCGTEIIIGSVIYSLNKANTISTGCSSGSTNGVNRELAMLTSFDWHPAVHLVVAYASGDLTYPVPRVTLSDLDNWTTITSQQLNTLKDVALLSYFDVPSRY